MELGFTQASQGSLRTLCQEA
jgi:hypothetical protein